MNLQQREILANLKLNLREEKFPCFSDDELTYVLNKYNFDLERTTYECLVMKAQDDTIRLPSGLSIQSSRNYWLSIAKRYRQNAGGSIKREGEEY